MNYDLILALIFYFILYAVFLTHKKKFDVQNKVFIMYRTQWGIRFMEKIAEAFPKFLRVLSYVSIGTGFLGMAFIFFILFKGTLALLTSPAAQPIIAPILPGVRIPGAPTLSFWHWIIGILFVATIHEFMHGVYCKVYKIKIKSSGFAFLGPILAAFVEPEEEQLKKTNKHTQLSIISAGPFANFILAGFMMILLLFVLNPLGNTLIEYKGVRITSIDENLPINQTVLRSGMIIEAINGLPVKNTEEFSRILSTFKPGQIITVTSNATKISVQLAAQAANPQKAKLGVALSPASIGVKEKFSRYKFLYNVFVWTVKLSFWIFTISLGVGLFNLLPLGPVDGGRMFMLVALWITKDNEEKAKKIWITFTLICLILIGINLLPLLFKLLEFIFSPILLLITSLF